MRHLVVDDSRTSRLALAAMLRAAGPGCEVEEAGSLDEALAAFGRQRPDFVFLDLQLDLQVTGTPGGSTGLVVLDCMLREDPGARVVVVTALPADHPDVLDAVDLGAAAVMGKPVTRDALARALALARPAA
ncbi:MAG TPA: response regulator [Candidatus Thermoplasmatota archaeon]|jgi:CheY-like chemotaxis protein|nr:response regulator [Candidatus Thermoplasmatota archaeon]